MSAYADSGRRYPSFRPDRAARVVDRDQAVRQRAGVWMAVAAREVRALRGSRFRRCIP